MIPRMGSCMIEMIEKWGSSSEVDVHKEFINLTAPVIARTAFGSTSVVGMKVAELQHKQILNLQKALRSIYIPGMRYSCDWSIQNNVLFNVYDNARGTFLVIIFDFGIHIHLGEGSFQRRLMYAGGRSTMTSTRSFEKLLRVD